MSLEDYLTADSLVDRVIEVSVGTTTFASADPRRLAKFALAIVDPRRRMLAEFGELIRLLEARLPNDLITGVHYDAAKLDAVLKRAIHSRLRRRDGDIHMASVLLQEGMRHPEPGKTRQHYLERLQAVNALERALSPFGTHSAGYPPGFEAELEAALRRS